MNTAQLIEFGSNHLALVAAFFALLALLIGGELRRRFSGVADVSPAEATRIMNSKSAVTVDMRSDKEFAAGHIADALRIPQSGDASGLEKFRERPLIVYCNSGNRSIGICHKLRKQGFAEVYNLRGGIAAWQKSDLPLSRKG